MKSLAHSDVVIRNTKTFSSGMHVSSWNLNFPKNNIYKFLRIPWISSPLNHNLINLQIPGPHMHSWELHSKYFNCYLNYEISRTFRFSHKKHKNIFFRNARELQKSEFSEKQYLYQTQISNNIEFLSFQTTESFQKT